MVQKREVSEAQFPRHIVQQVCQGEIVRAECRSRFEMVDEAGEPHRTNAQGRVA